MLTVFIGVIIISNDLRSVLTFSSHPQGRTTAAAAPVATRGVPDAIAPLHPNVTLKRLPFYDKQGVVLKPTHLRGQFLFYNDFRRMHPSFFCLLKIHENLAKLYLKGLLS